MSARTHETILRPASTDEVRLWARAGLLAALALVLSYIETFIPLPVPFPGVKLGLANIIVLVALYVLDAKSAAVIALIKVLAAGFLFGTPLMIAYSAVGTALAFAAMALLSRVRSLDVVVPAIAGAVMHNVGQLLVARVMLGTQLVWASAPVLVIAAIVMGAISGLAARYALVRVPANTPNTTHDAAPQPADRAAAPQPADRAAAPQPTDRAAAPQPTDRRAAPRAAASGALLHPNPSAERPQSCHPERSAEGAESKDLTHPVDARIKLLALIIYIIVALHASLGPALAVCAAVAIATCIVARVRMHDIVRAVAPLLAIVVITAIAQVLYYQNGTALLQIGSLRVTDVALLGVACMSVCLACIMAASIACMRCTKVSELTAALSWAIRPLRRLGVRTELFEFAFSSALSFLPVLVGEFKTLKNAQLARLGDFEGGVVARVRAYMRLIGPLTHNVFERSDMLGDAASSRCVACGIPRTRQLSPASRARSTALIVGAALLCALAIAL